VLRRPLPANALRNLSARASAVANSEAEPNSPIDGFVRASKPCWPRREMGKAVFDGSNRELALHMELRLKTPGGAADRSEPQSQDIDEEARASPHRRLPLPRGWPGQSPDQVRGRP
jgi:hypothetical protein